MQEMYKLEGTVLTVVLPQDVDHPVTDLVRRETDHIINQNYIRTIIFDFTHTEFMDSSGVGSFDWDDTGQWECAKRAYGQLV